MALRFLNKTPFHLAPIALLGLLAYSNTFDTPFQWDEKDFIARQRKPMDNKLIFQDLSSF
ncbi:MAG: hypothetical protein Q8J64_03100 [Thermodesulfovibrionales bacterium]|nr:hypothetical protein [Thermodesulfovibrionales bacterium]